MKNIALYLRLSHADNDLGKNDKDESNSIENQRTLLMDYVEHNEQLTGSISEYVDDGYTGTNFDRPGFISMIEDAKKGQIGVIIVKDLSRLGRDYIGVGDYLEQIFPQLGIRVIAVNSNYDSNNYQGNTVGLDVNITNLVNSLYSKDLSKKVKSGKVTKWKNGESTGEQQPFGYIRDPLKQKSWIIDEDAANIVRLIFQKAVDGWNTHMITDLLNEQKIPTPSLYMKQKYNASFPTLKVSEAENIWDMGKVWRVITNYSYTGNVYHGKRTRIVVGSSTQRKVQERNQYLIMNAIPAIVSQETFDKAQLVIGRKGTYNKGNDKGYALTRKIKCGNCKLSMCYKEKNGLCLYCRHAATSGSETTCDHIDYPAEIIENQVYRVIKQQIEVLVSLGEMVALRRSEDTKEQMNSIALLEKRKNDSKLEKIRCYESYANGSIPLEEFQSRNKEITDELNEILHLIDAAEKDKEKADEIISGINKTISKAEKVITGSKLTRNMVNTFVEMVYVYDINRIEVFLKYRGLIETANEWLK